MKKIEVLCILFLHLLSFITLLQCQETEFLKHSKCSLNDSPCLTREAQNTVQAFVEGVPGLGIKKLDKLNIDPVIVHLPNFSYAWTDIKVGGLKNAILDNVSIDMDLGAMRVTFHTTALMEFDYEADGILISLPVLGKGKGTIQLTNLHMEILFLFDIIKEDNGHDFMNLRSYYYGIGAVDDVHTDFKNLYNGDEQKSAVFHRLVNENWRTMLANFGVYFHNKITDKIFDAVKIYMRSRPLKDLAVY